MLENGTILYLFLFALLAWFWWRVRGLSFNELLDRSAHEHHLALEVAMKHPRGAPGNSISAGCETSVRNISQRVMRAESAQ